MNRVVFLLIMFTLSSCTYGAYTKKSAINLFSPHPNGRGKVNNVPHIKQGKKVFIKK